MAVNPHFKHIDAANEQELYHDLAEELIQMAGVDVYYIKAEGLQGSDFDSLFGENRFEKLGEGIQIEMFIEGSETPYGGSDMFSKFGLTQAQTVSFLVSYRRFEDMFDMRPREGDFVYIPKFDKRTPADIFRISFVDVDKHQFEPLGTTLFFHLSTERARYSHESINTGVDELDAVAADMPNGTDLDNDTNADNDLIQSLGDMFQNFDESNPFGRA